MIAIITRAYKLGLGLLDAVIFKMTNAKCETFNKSWVLVYNCRLKAVRRHVTVLNINSTYLHPVNKLSVHGQLFKKANGYKPWLINVTFDACRYLRRPNNPAVSMVFNLFKEFTNINHKCPFYGPQLVEGFYLKPELLRLPLPTGDYLLEITWIFIGHNIIRTYILNLLRIYKQVNKIL
ncbi:uncharacterized protein LOC124459685 [Drosophila willistoni]|uniref:uncharacterized protein LOC124459685 n=1 Tax=Drosophila willistoni TaxID=7260 RepID=UPI001F07F48D|nr:uncharacterized protein LOC124459685 [Drosophila willistoni]